MALGLCLSGNKSVSCFLNTSSGQNFTQLPFESAPHEQLEQSIGDEIPGGAQEGQEKLKSQGRGHKEDVGEAQAVLPCRMCILTRSDRSGLLLILCLR